MINKLIKKTVVLVALSFVGGSLTVSAKNDVISKEALNIGKTTAITELKEKVQEQLKKFDPQEILVSIDIDMTMIQPRHPALTYKRIQEYQEEYRSLLSKLPSEYRMFPFMYIAYSEPHQVVDSAIVDTIQELQSLGVTVIAFTTSPTGQIGPYKQFEEFRYQQLRNFGIHFDVMNHGESVTFPEFSKRKNSPPKFYKGILFASGTKGNSQKGKVMSALLSKLTLVKAVLMIDDKFHNIRDVAEVVQLEHPDLRFWGCQYTKALEYAPGAVDKKAFIEKWSEIIRRTQEIIPNPDSDPLVKE